MAKWGGTQRRDWRERFVEKVDRRGDDECWPWLGAVNKRSGYGVFGKAQGVILSAHVVAIEYATGEPVPEGMWVDHVRKNGCVRRDCVNWLSHLEVVTPGENLRRAVGDTCQRGHAWAMHGYQRPNGTWVCRTCATQGQREYRARKKKELRHDGAEPVEKSEQRVG
jgi:hypothetical protein